MEPNNKKVGIRLREIREIFHDGVKLTADQFAFLLDETGDKIRNYETGRATISIRLLISLYKQGINPTYLITGEGNIFADNEAGKNRQNAIRLNYEKGKLEDDNKIILAAAGKLYE